jgi:putative heme-binding domain-containing protein
MALDWGADGRLWVAEVGPSATEAQSQGGSDGAVKLLSDSDGDGRYDHATVFLPQLPCPSGVMAWGRGVLICAAPDLIYAEDTSGDGQADVAQRLVVGFDAADPALRLNSLSLGLDNWIHGANGTRGGTVQPLAGLGLAPVPLSSELTSLAGHDFRFRPDTADLEPVSGVSAFARVRDDANRWFGCDAEASIWQYPLPDSYRRRNPHATLPDDAVLVFRGAQASSPSPRTTSLCLNRGEFPGSDSAGDAFLCEAEPGLVRHLVMTQSEGRFIARETPTPFLQSSDPACQPIQIRMGPDGALWILVRHSSPAPPRMTAQPAGQILRLRPKATKSAAIPDLTRLPIADLVSALDTANGAERDRVHAHLLHRRDPAAATSLRDLARRSRWPACRTQALCVLEGFGQLAPQDLETALHDPHADVRAQAIRLSEPFLREVDAQAQPRLETALLELVTDAEWTVRYQLALSLGEWSDARAGEALGRLAAAGLSDTWFRAALLTSAGRFSDAILGSVLSLEPVPPAAASFVNALAVTAANGTNDAGLTRFVSLLNGQTSTTQETLALGGLARLLEVVRDRPPVPGGPTPDSRWGQAAAAGAGLEQRARALVRDPQTSEPARLSAVRLLGHTPKVAPDDLDLFSEWLVTSDSTRLKQAALDALIATRRPGVADLLLARWSREPPSLRRAIVGPLVARPDWALRLLDAVDKGWVATAEVTPVNRERLLNDRNVQVRERAKTVFSLRLPERRREVVAKFLPALSLVGDPAKGRVTFENLCSRCHGLAGIGVTVGADLTTVGTRTTAELLESILDPTATIEPRYVNYQIETDDDRSLSGIVIAEDGAQLTVVQPGGKVEEVALKSLTELRASNLSLMPEGLEQGQTPQGLADLLAFIRSCARQPSPAPSAPRPER